MAHLTEEQMKALRVPTRLDDMPKALFWDADAFAIGATMMFLALMTGHFWVGVVLAVFSTKRFQDAKNQSNGAPGYIRHLFYWLLPGTFGLNRVPPSSLRRFQG
ncbi:hypothetical protein WT27_13085 [Burkholderia territorii]|nr:MULTISPECIES: type IV conjugative transfer system protein TraL [Burkholderia cepacia complex]KVV40856.1 hypothetical protein WT27_13085 [Burkholderia territorii]KVX33803.1 hypothetical protein WT31_08985 [Burkholderia territorii]MBR8189180.1 type IV conjugative transfer system protein TraL [Burkholderia vietnamiensis]HDR9174387.1 type IV conjugative transfer system protein TraL [Burkholderia vietnamiensis]